MAKIDLGYVIGPPGPKPIKGIDYYTEEEKQQFTIETLNTIVNEGNRVLEEINKIIENSPESGNALALSGKTRLEYDKEIQGIAGGYSGSFPLTTAEQYGIYLLPKIGKLYICTKAYSGSTLTAPNANFEELSVYKNREKLNNLNDFQILTDSKDIIINKKITHHRIYRLGNMIFGLFVIENSEDAIFEYNEPLITFPFKAKTEYRSGSVGGKEFTFIVYENKNTINFLVPDGVNVKQTTCNFYFLI